MAFLTWVIRQRRAGRRQVVRFQDGGTNPPLSEPPTMGLKGSLKGEGDEPQPARLSQPPRACFLGASSVIYGVWLATGCNANKLVASKTIMKAFSPRRKEGVPLHRARASLYTGQIWQCFGYRCWGTHPLGHMLINHGRTMAKNLKTSPTKRNLCKLPPASLLNE